MTIATGQTATAADVLAALAAKMSNSIAEANALLYSVSDNTPAALAMAASRICARLAAGNIVAATPAQIMALLSGSAGAEFLLNTQKIGGVVDPTTAQQVATKKYVDDHLAVATGTYTGNDTDDRQITTGFKCSMVLLMSEATVIMWIAMPDGTLQQRGGTTAHVTDLLLHATDGFVVDQVDANRPVYDPYNWWAISE